MKIVTEAVGFSADQKLKDFIEKKLSKLEQFFSKIIETEVYLKLENSGQVKDKIVEVRLHVPGDTIFNKTTDKSFESAIDQAVESLSRQLKKYKETMRSY